MMNWNSNDTKYIIKRIILYFIIAGIVFFAGQSCAKAAIRTETISNWQVNETTSQAHEILPSNSNYWKFGSLMSLGQGDVIFQLVAQSGYRGQTILQQVFLKNNVNTYLCDVGNSYTYYDNDSMQRLYTVRCPIVGNGETLQIQVQSYGSEQTTYTVSQYITYVTETSDANAIVNGINQAIQTSMNTQTQNAITTQDLIRASNAAIATQTAAIEDQTAAIEDQTEAIQEQTEWFEQQHDPLIDTGFLDVMGDLITTNDSDVVRQFIMIPFNLFVQIYNACTSNTCSALTLGTLYGTTLTLPCINWTTLVGSAIANTIDIIFSACLIFGMYRMIKHMINKIFTLSSTITDECGVEVFK